MDESLEKALAEEVERNLLIYHRKQELYLTAVGVVTGFSITALAEVDGVTSIGALSFWELWAAATAVISLGVQSVLWINELHAVLTQWNMMVEQGSIIYLASTDTQESQVVDRQKAAEFLGTVSGELKKLAEKSRRRLPLLRSVMLVSIVATLLLISLRIMRAS